MSSLPRPMSQPSMSFTGPRSVSDRRRHRRHDLERQGIAVERWDGARKAAAPFGQIIDISAGGVRLRVAEAIRADKQIRVRLELPAFAGISPFIDTSDAEPRAKREWVGWMSVNRVQKIAENEYDVAGVLVDMEDMDRGMLGLYLSTQPLAA
ncbi:MAG TPA: PilZ domain-containing protein [Tepidisphaeraceae bacterium]